MLLRLVAIRWPRPVPVEPIKDNVLGFFCGFLVVKLSTFVGNMESSLFELSEPEQVVAKSLYRLSAFLTLVQYLGMVFRPEDLVFEECRRDFRVVIKAAWSTSIEISDLLCTESE